MNDFACIEGKPGTAKYKHLIRSFLAEKQISEPTLITPSAEAQSVLLSFDQQNELVREGPRLEREDCAYTHESILGRHGPWFVMEINKIDDPIRGYIEDDNIELATRDTWPLDSGTVP